MSIYFSIDKLAYYFLGMHSSSLKKVCPRNCQRNLKLGVRIP